MPVIVSKKDWWDTVDAYWEELLFLFQHYVGLGKVLPDGTTIKTELEYLKKHRDVYITEVLELLYEHVVECEVPEPLLDEAVSILYDLHDSHNLLYQCDRVYKDKGRGNANEGLKKNEGLEGKRARFKQIMVSSWAKEI